jgi:glycyl-tRNA synthetase alpha chain
LDARGVIGVAQRAEYISRIRELAKGSGKTWLESQK